MLFDPFQAHSLRLNNRTVMSPMTRNRALGNVPNAARAVATEIGPERVGMRLSPCGVFNGTGTYPDVRSQYFALADELSNIGLLYMHVLDHAAMGAPPVPEVNRESAEKALQGKHADLIAFGRPFLANPDLVDRMRSDAPLNAPDAATFYVPGPKGYTDYPTLT